jgi:hypothetical protein
MRTATWTSFLRGRPGSSRRSRSRLISFWRQPSSRSKRSVCASCSSRACGSAARLLEVLVDAERGRVLHRRVVDLDARPVVAEDVARAARSGTLAPRVRCVKGRLQGARVNPDPGARSAGRAINSARTTRRERHVDTIESVRCRRASSRRRELVEAGQHPGHGRLQGDVREAERDFEGFWAKHARTSSVDEAVHQDPRRVERAVLQVVPRRRAERLAQLPRPAPATQPDKVAIIFEATTARSPRSPTRSSITASASSPTR